MSGRTKKLLRIPNFLTIRTISIKSSTFVTPSILFLLIIISLFDYIALATLRVAQQQKADVYETYIKDPPQIDSLKCAVTEKSGEIIMHLSAIARANN